MAQLTGHQGDVLVRVWHWVGTLTLLFASGVLICRAQEAIDDDAARQTADRFLMVLERNPRRGTALDKVVAFHLDHGSLDELVAELRKKAEAAADDKPDEAGRAWLVVGLIDDSRADVEAAVKSFERAEKLLPKNAVASYLLGQALIALNRHADGAAAFERAIQRKPASIDLLDVFQALGRVQQRLTPITAGGSSAEATTSIVEVWSRLEKLVPNDPRVPELIAKTLLEDGYWEAALPRFESLAKSAKDPYRRSEWELEALDLRLKLGQTERALTDADRLLNNLKPEHWLFRETRRRVEEAFLAQDDVAGWIKHLESRLAAQPGDVDAVIRLARALAGLGREDEARTRLEAAIKVAPNSPDLRLELIELLQSQQKFAEAISQFEELDRIAPNNTDYVRDWGLLVLKSGERAGVSPPTAPDENEANSPGPDGSRLAERAARAATIWLKLVEAKPKDAVVAAQVADWMTSADKSLLNDAADLLRKGVELEPDSLSHREQLGEVLDAAGKKSESLATWRAMAEGSRRTAANLAHLAEVLNRFGYRGEALGSIDAACELDRKSLELRFQQAELRRNWKQFEAAMSALAEAAKLADTPETFDRVVQNEVRVLSEGELLAERIEELQTSTTRERVVEKDGSGANQSGSHSLALRAGAQHFRLAKYLEAAGKLREATVAARKAVELDPNNGVFLQATGKMLAADSQWLSAVEVYERLLKLDRRFRIDSLRAIAEMEQKLGRKDRAMKAGRDLLAAAPANPEAAEFVVDLCVHFGQQTDALQILRRASRQNPAHRKLAMKLVDRLMDSPGGSPAAAGQAAGGRNSANGSRLTALGQTFDEAREVLWRVFEKSNRADDRAEVAKKLGELSVLPGEFAKLIARLERLRHEPKLTRDATLALINVHEQAGDTQQARRELDRLLPTSPRDADLLKRAVALSEAMGDLEAAIAQQQRLAEVTRRRDADEHLIVLLRRAGRDADANALAVRWLESERDPAKLLKEIDRLINDAVVTKNQSLEQALRLIHNWLDREPQHWEFLLRQATALYDLNRVKESWAVYDEVMALPIPDETRSILAPARSAVASDAERAAQRIQEVRSRLNFDKNAMLDYGAARCVVLFHRVSHKVEPVIPQPLGLDAKVAALRSAWDECYLNMLRGGGSDRLRVRLELLSLSPDDPAAQWLALTGLYGLRNEKTFRAFGAWREFEGVEPLDGDTLDRLMAACRSLQSCDEAMEWDRTPVVEMLCRELVRARRHDDVKALLAEWEQSGSHETLGWLVQQAAINDDVDAALRVVAKLAADESTNSPAGKSTARGGAKRSDPAQLAWWLSRCLVEQPEAANRGRLSPRVVRVLDAAFAAFGSDKLPPAVPNPTVSTQPFAYSANQNRNQRGVGLSSTPYELGLVWKTAEQFQADKVDFPSAESMLDVSVLYVLRQAWSQAQTPAARDELVAHARAARDRAAPDSRQKFLWEVALAALPWWNRESANDTANATAEALAVMRRVFDSPHATATLKFSIAACHIKSEQPDVALKLLDQIETPDNGLRKEIEQRAVALSVKSKDAERLKLAAERLFGMKLDPQEELQLAATLSGLGLHEHAEAIRMRLPQRAGNNLLALQQLMDEHSEAKRIDEACAVAEQIVRRTAPANPLIGSSQQATFSGGQQARVITQTSVARTKALRLLGQHGRLEPLIAQAEQQFERSQSLKLFGLLAELYEAAELDRAKSAERQGRLVVRLADSDAADPQFRLTLARALVSASHAKLAVPHFLFAIERLPDATAQVLFEAEQILAELGHVDELARIVLKSKLSVNDQQRIELFSRIVARLDGQPPREKLIIQLFDKALREAPEFRHVLAARLLEVQATLSAQDEFFPLLRDLAVPAESVTAPGPMFGIDVIRQTKEREIDSITRRIVWLAESQKQLDEFATHVEAAMKRHPDWSLGGRVTLGRIRLKQGRLAEAKELLAVLREQASGRASARRQTNGSVDAAESTLALLVCGLGLDFARAGDFDGAVSFYELSSDEDIVLQHCRWFAKEPAMQRLAVRLVDRMLTSLDNADELTRRAGSPQFIEAAKILAEIDQPYSAARLTQAMITRWQLPGANHSDGGVWLRQLEDRFANARAAMKAGWRPDAESGQATLDLLVHVSGDSLATLRLDSPFARSPRGADGRQPSDKAASDKVRGLTPPGSPKLLAFAIFDALHRLDADSAKSSEATTAALQQLAKVAAADLKSTRSSRTAPPGDHPQLGLWLVARECLVRDDLKSFGQQLADLAVDGAAQHFDPRYRWAILRERGELALKAGDKQLASKLWQQLAEDVLRPRTSDESVPMLIGQDFVWSANWAAVRMKRARELCLMALHGELSELSLSMFRDAVSFEAASSADDVVAAWDALEPEWRAKRVSSDAIFTTLLECVLPSNRPNDVFVFAVVRTPTSEQTDSARIKSREKRTRPDVGVRTTDGKASTATPESLAQRLVELAVAEKRIESLSLRLNERDKSVANPLALRLISLLLAQQTRDDARLNAELAKLGQHDWSKPADADGRIATQVVSRLMPLADDNRQVADLLDGLIPLLAKTNSRDEHPLADLRRWAARRQLTSQNIDKAKETISAHLRHMDQVWSAAGAMDGQHLKRLELLTLAEGFVAAGLTGDALDLLAQVADARWPDKFPDENPGDVLALLEVKLQSLSAQERYELWRGWTLPNDALKSMRMLSGAVNRNSEVRDPKTDADRESQITLAEVKHSRLKSTALLLVNAAREAKRLPELLAVVEQQMKQRPNDRLHVLAALIHLASESPQSAEPHIRRQLAAAESQGSRSTTRTRVWDDWMLSRSETHDSLRDLASQLADRAIAGAKELRDSVLLDLANEPSRTPSR